MTALPAPIPASGTGPGDVLPVVTTADVLAVLPAFLKPGDPAAVRDGMIAALTAIIVAYQSASGFSSANSDVLRAKGIYLDGLGKDRKVFRAPSELDPSYRARILGIPSMVTPAALVAGVNAILAPFTTVQCQYFESGMDRWYARTKSATTGFHSFVWSRATIGSRRCPYYLDRLYQDDAAANGGAFRPNSAPGGARVFSDRIGRFLCFRIPDLSALNLTGVFAFNTQDDPPRGASPIYWTPSTAYSTSSIGGAKYYLPTQGNQTGYWYFPTNRVSALSGSVEPTWPVVPGEFVVDGGVVWLCKGAMRPIGLGMYVRTKAHGGTQFGCYPRARGTNATTVYASVASLIDRLKGASIRAAIFVDATLH